MEQNMVYTFNRDKPLGLSKPAQCFRGRVLIEIMAIKKNS